jgi:hypothetical protein
MLLGITKKMIDDIEASLGCKLVNQASHGLSVNDWVYFNGTNYVVAQADALATSEVLGVVVEVVDANNFKLQTDGHVTGLSGLTAGTVYFLSDSAAGEITATEPTTEDHISKPLLIADTTTSGYIFNWRGVQIVSGNGVYATTFVDGDLSSGVLTVSHSLDYQYPQVTIVDNNDQMLGSVDSIDYTDADNLDVDLSSQGTLTGTWRVVCIGASTGNIGKSIADADGDTVVHTEESADEDIIRFDTGGTERATIDANGTLNVTQATANYCVNLTQNGNATAFYIDKNGTGGNALSIDVNATSNRAISINQAGANNGIYLNQTGAATAVEIDNDSSGIGLHIHQDDTGASNYALKVDNYGSGWGIYLEQHTVSSASRPAMYIYSSQAHTNANSALFKVNQAGATASEPAIEIVNAGDGYSLEISHNKSGNTASALRVYTLGTGQGIHVDKDGTGGTGIQIDNAGVGRGLWVNQDGNGVALEVDNAGTNHGLYIHQDGALAAGNRALYVYSNAEQDNSGCELVRIHSDNPASSQPAVRITQDASSTALIVTSSATGGRVMQLSSGNDLAHINLQGDPTVAAPGDGDLWYTGSELNFYDGSTTYDLLSVGGGSTNDFYRTFHPYEYLNGGTYTNDQYTLGTGSGTVNCRFDLPTQMFGRAVVVDSIRIWYYTGHTGDYGTYYDLKMDDNAGGSSNVISDSSDYGNGTTGGTYHDVTFSPYTMVSSRGYRQVLSFTNTNGTMILYDIIVGYHLA